MKNADKLKTWVHWVKLNPLSEDQLEHAKSTEEVLRKMEEAEAECAKLKQLAEEFTKDHRETVGRYQTNIDVLEAKLATAEAEAQRLREELSKSHEYMQQMEENMITQTLALARANKQRDEALAKLEEKR